MTDLIDATEACPRVGALVDASRTDGDGILFAACEGCGRRYVGTDSLGGSMTVRVVRSHRPPVASLDARRRTRDAARLAELLAGFGVDGPDRVVALSELEWQLAASSLRLPAAPDARLRAAVADAFRVPAGVS